MTELPNQSSMKFNKPISAVQKFVIAFIGGGMALFCFIALLSPSGEATDTREDKWMEVMELTDQQLANTAEINACQLTITENTAENIEIANQKEMIKDEVFGFGGGTR